MSATSEAGPAQAAWVYNEHDNDLGDWCPYSGEPFDGQWDTPEQDVEAQGCPQNCRSSWLDEAPPAARDLTPSLPAPDHHPTTEAHPSPGL